MSSSLHFLVLLLYILCFSWSSSAQYWRETITRRGSVTFQPDTTYPYYRNVRDFGAKGDGIADDTAAINNAVSFPGVLGTQPVGNSSRCGYGRFPQGQLCGSSTIQPALVYFPPGTYKISNSIVLFYMTQAIGDAVNPPTILVARNYTRGGATIGEAAFDANIYIPGFGGAGLTWWDNQNNFYRQVRNFNFDLTQGPNDTAAIHWQVAQATGLQNIRINMRPGNSPGNRQVGINMENGSGGWFSDITINGGMIGMSLGSQQFTSRRITINGATTAIKFVFNWIWLFAQVTITNCDIGFDMSNGGFTNQATSQVMVIDSVISAKLGILSLYAPGYSSPQAAGSLLVERVDFTGSNTAVAVGLETNSRIILPGSQFVPIFAQGNAWTSAGQELNGQIFNGTTCTFQNQTQQVKTARQQTIQRQLAPIPRPASLVDPQGNWVGRPRPQYETLQPSDFLSAREFGLFGDGVRDDSDRMQEFFNAADAQGKVAYLDKGAYIVEKTVQLPKDLKVVGELWSIIMARGAFFGDMDNPKVMWRVGKPGELGTVEFVDLVFETQGPCPGAILVEWNIKQAYPGGAGFWDAHYRIGGTAGTDILVDKCRKTPGVRITRDSQVVKDCYGAFMLLHVTPQANIYMENVWGWVSDHQLDAPDRDQIYVFNGRGFLIEGEGPNWFWGTASEHSVLYDYQFVNASNSWLGVIQHETAYFQGNPPAPEPYNVIARYYDPDFSDCVQENCARTWGLRFVNSRNIYNYGGGHYMFFNNWDAPICLGTETCQERMIEFINSTDIWLWATATKGSEYMISLDGTSLIPQAVNKAGFTQNIVLFELTANQ